MNRIFNYVLRQRLFLLFLIIAMALWYVNKMGYRYKTELRIPIEIVSDQNSMGWVENPTMEVTCLVEAKGSVLVRYIHGSEDVIKIPLTSLAMSDCGGFDYSIGSNSLKEALMVAQNRMVIYQVVDTIPWVRIIPMRSATLPIQSNITINCKKQFMVVGRVELQPSTLTVRSASSILDTMKSIRTESLVLDDQQRPVSSSIGLVIPDGVIVPQTSVRFNADITGYTELEYNIPVEIKNMLPGWTTLPSPSRVTLLVRVPLSTFGHTHDIVTPVATIDYNDRNLQRGSLFRVSVGNLPQGGEVAKIMPEYVELFITKGD